MRPSASCEWPEQNRLEYGFGTSVVTPVIGSHTRSTPEVVNDPVYIRILPVCSITMLTATNPSSVGAPHCPTAPGFVVFSTLTTTAAEVRVLPAASRATAVRVCDPSV